MPVVTAQASGRSDWSMSPGIVAESDLSGNLKAEYVFFDGRRTARRDLPSGTVSYYFSDDLGTASVITNAAGNITEDEDFYPWGGELSFVSNDSNRYKFGGHERDNETGLDYMLARYYSNPLGRFLTPDWAAKPITVPYANFGNPQSLNLYTFGKNNPTTFGDPDGHCADGDPCSKITVTVAPAKGEEVPHPIENAHLKGIQNGQPVDVYKSGVGLNVDVTFSNKKGPISGLQVTESNSSGPGTLVQNQEPATTNDKGQITDLVMRGVTSDPQPLNITDKSSEAAPSHQDLIDHVNGTPYSSTQTQTLTFTTTDKKGKPCTCQATYDRTLSNTDSKGNLNTQTNSKGVNYNFSKTDPVVKKQPQQ